MYGWGLTNVGTMGLWQVSEVISSAKSFVPLASV